MTTLRPDFSLLAGWLSGVLVVELSRRSCLMSCKRPRDRVAGMARCKGGDERESDKSVESAGKRGLFFPILKVGRCARILFSSFRFSSVYSDRLMLLFSGSRTRVVGWGHRGWRCKEFRRCLWTGIADVVGGFAVRSHRHKASSFRSGPVFDHPAHRRKRRGGAQAFIF